MRAKRYGWQFGEKAVWIRQLNCLVCGWLPSEPHHVKSRGAGGDSTHLVPLCTRHHREFHTIGRTTFGKKHDIDLPAEAERLEARWQGGDTDLGF